MVAPTWYSSIASPLEVPPPLQLPCQKSSLWCRVILERTKAGNEVPANLPSRSLVVSHTNGRKHIRYCRHRSPPIEKGNVSSTFCGLHKLFVQSRWRSDVYNPFSMRLTFTESASEEFAAICLDVTATSVARPSNLTAHPPRERPPLQTAVCGIWSDRKGTNGEIIEPASQEPYSGGEVVRHEVEQNKMRVKGAPEVLRDLQFVGVGVENLWGFC